MALCLIGLGANLGDRRAALDQAVRMVSANPVVRVVACSAWRETRAVGGSADQPPFLNGALLAETSLAPKELLAMLQGIEDALGRVRGVRWGPRTIDLDLLLYDQVVLDSPALTLPHPRMAFRRFVLQPAADVAPEMLHAIIGWTVRELLAHVLRATPYVAIAGPPGSGKTEIAKLAAHGTQAQLLLDVSDEAALAAAHADPAGRAWKTELELLERRQRLLDRAAWASERTIDPTAGVASQWTVSDFWFDQSWAYASVWLNEPRKGDFERLWRQMRETVVPPKLLVVLDAPPDVVADQIASIAQRYGQPLAATRLVEAHDAIRNLAAQPGLGPVLRLSEGDARQAADEIMAAIQAMQ